MISNIRDAVYMPDLTIYPHAVRIRPLGGSPTLPKVSAQSLANLRSNPDADGRIKGLSAHSLSRLRAALACIEHIEPALCYGVCLTIPWGKPGEDGCPDQHVAGLVWRDFQHNLARLVDFLRLGSAFRVELQIRQTTHWHLVAFLPVSLDWDELQKRWRKIMLSKNWRALPCSRSPFPTKKRKDGHPMIDVADRDVDREITETHFFAFLLLRAAWMRACCSVHEKLKGAAPIKSWEYCVNVIPCRDMSTAYSYLASHSTKHKQEQLGYVGKQWGYIGKKWLKESQGESIQGFSTHLCKSRRAVGFRLIRKWISKHRSKSLSRLVKPRRRVTEEDYILYSGLSVRNHNVINLFGVPSSVILQALDAGAVTPCRLARGVVKLPRRV